jgi:hypothetical protein
MLPFHCPIQPNEHLFSWVSRIHLLSGNIKLKSTLAFLNIENKPFNCTGHNQAFLDAINFYRSEIVDDEICFDRHTLFSLWALSFNSSDYNERRSNNSLLMPSMNEKGAFSFNSRWKYCPNCIQDDIDKCGHSFWHVKHQLPSVTHCYLHKEVLIGNSIDFRDLRNCSLPQTYDYCISKQEVDPQLLSWSEFVVSIYNNLNQSPRFGETLKNRVINFLQLPTKIQTKHNDLFQDLQRQFDKEVPLAIRRHLFSFYSKPYRTQPRILRSTLGINHNTKHKHPVNWLIILYWLKDKISLGI